MNKSANIEGKSYPENSNIMFWIELKDFNASLRLFNPLSVIALQLKSSQIIIQKENGLLKKFKIYSLYRF